MPPDPLALNYGRDTPPRWRRVARLTAHLLLLAIVIAGGIWTAVTGWQSVERYRFQQNYFVTAAALTQSPVPPGTIVIDPASGPVWYMKAYKTTNGHGAVRTPTLPPDPIRSARLLRMGRFGQLFSSDVQTGRGKSFVTADITDHELADGTMRFWIRVDDMILRPGRFPLYKYSISGDFTGLGITTSKGRPPPTFYAGQLDADAAGWTLPLRIDGKPEWVHFDHSGPGRAVLTASFGTLMSNGPQWELTD